MVKTVHSDLPVFISEQNFRVAVKGLQFACWVNSHGAISVIQGEHMLGVKSEEFKDIEFHSSEQGE